MSENWLTAVQEAIHENDPEMVEAKTLVQVLTPSKNKRCLTPWGQSGFSGVREDCRDESDV
jgi:hypothetical protein